MKDYSNRPGQKKQDENRRGIFEILMSVLWLLGCLAAIAFVLWFVWQAFISRKY